MLRQFWRTIGLLVLISTIFSLASWWYLLNTEVALMAPATKSQLLSLPTSIPSIWNIIRPSTNISWMGPFLVLIVQVFLTGGFYGSLVRANSQQSTSVVTFLGDARRSFWRLFMWNLLWTGLNILMAGVVQVFPQMNVTLTATVLLLRYLFLFGDVALVSERNIAAALKSAMGALFSGVIAMLPYGVMVVLITSIAMSISTYIPWFALLGLAIVYGPVMTWVLHMIVARYLYFSNWAKRAGVAVMA